MEIISNLLGVVEIVVFAHGVVQMKFHKNKCRVMAAMIMLLAASVIQACYPDKNVGMICGNILGVLTGMILLFDEPLIRKVIKYFFARIYAGMIYIIFRLPGTLLNIFINVNDETVNIISSVLTVIFLLVVTQVIKRHKRIVLMIKEISFVYYCIAILYGAITNFISAYIELTMVNYTAVVSGIMVGISSVLSIIMCNFGLGFVFVELWRKQYKSENELRQRHLQSLKNYYEEIHKYVDEIRSVKHDIGAHMRHLKAYSEKREWGRFDNYLEYMEKEYDLDGVNIINVGNVYASAAITEAMGSIKRGEDIVLECKGTLPIEMDISDFSICTIFSNLLTNAIEACRRLKKKDKKIEVCLSSSDGSIYISVSNPIEWEMDINELSTLKGGEEHGYGLKNVHREVEAYGGTCEVLIDNGEFIVEILFL